MPQPNFPHHECFKTDMFFQEENNKINIKKNAIVCFSPKKEEIKTLGNDSLKNI